VSSQEEKFWQTIPLDEMTEAQWESLCDGCGKCCLEKLEDAETHQIVYTNVACKLLDLDRCRCRDYPRRSERVPDCIRLTPARLHHPYWLPERCAYRLIAEGRPLPAWHPLVTGDPESVVAAGESMRGRAVSETEVDDLEWHLIDWVR